MKKKIVLILFAFTPLLFGNIINVLIVRLDWYGFSMFVLSVLFSVFWLYVGYNSSKHSHSIIEATLLGNSIALISYFTLLLSNVFLEHGIFSVIGFQMQMVFLPMIRLSATLLSFTGNVSVNSVYLLSTLIMIILFASGFKLQRSVKQ